MSSGAYEEEVAIDGLRYRVRCETRRGTITYQCAGCEAKEEYPADIFDRAEITEVPSSALHHAPTTVIVTSADLREGLLMDYVLGRRHRPGTSPDPEEIVWRAGVAHAGRIGELNDACAWMCSWCLGNDTEAHHA